MKNGFLRFRKEAAHMGLRLAKKLVERQVDVIIDHRVGQVIERRG